MKMPGNFRSDTDTVIPVIVSVMRGAYFTGNELSARNENSS